MFFTIAYYLLVFNVIGQGTKTLFFGFRSLIGIFQNNCYQRPETNTKQTV